jgi:hypothetical protein
VEPAATPPAVQSGNPATPSPTARSGGGGVPGSIDGGAGRVSPGAAEAGDDREGSGARPSGAPASPDTSPAAAIGRLSGASRWPPVVGLAAALLVPTGAFLLATAARRIRRSATNAGGAVPALSIPEGLDLDLLVTGALSGGSRVTGGRGSQVLDRAAPDPVAGASTADTPDAPATTAEGPVWVRRLDHRIPVLPTIGTLPVDHDGDDRRAARGTRRGR